MADHDLDAEVVRRFRAGEEIPGFHRDRLLLLTTTGRRSGTTRTTPVMRVAVDGDPLVVASADGAASHPDWYRNLAADAAVVVETPDGRRTPSTAEVLQGEAYERAWTEVLERAPFFAEHQQRAGDRRIPLVRLRPAQ